MLTLTILKNPFNTAGREIIKTDFVPGKTVAQYCQPYTMELDDFVYSVNGKVVEADCVPDADDYIAVCPVVGKNLLASILMLALTVYTGGIAGATNGIFGAMNVFWRAASAIAINMIGGAIINTLSPTPQADTSSSTTTYGFNGLSTQLMQGGALARTYGTMITAGTQLTQHITTDGEKQFLNILLTGGQGPVDSITDIEINGNPIANYPDVILDTRLGLNDQTVIPNFGDTFFDQGLNYELNVHYASPGEWAMQQVEGNSTQGLEVTVELPNGLYHQKNDGGLEEAHVEIESQYSATGSGNWIALWTGSIKGLKNTALRRTFRVDNIIAGQYDVRMRCTGKQGVKVDDSIDIRYSNKVFWSQVSSIIYADFCRPNKILVGVKALATDKLSGGDIKVTWKQTVNKVWVWTTDHYSLLPATNNAWVSYDILHGCRQLKNIHTGLYEFVVDNIPASRIDYQPICDWADHCTLLGLHFNHIFDNVTDLWTALKVPETFGRGKIISKGTKYSAVCDKPSTPVQLFNVGNTKQGAAKEYGDITGRANAIEINFKNQDKDLQTDPITVYGDEWDASDTVENPTQITLDGCTSYLEAWQFGKYLLRLNKYNLRTETWEADIDAIACAMGDQVLLQQDVSQWGFGGRIEAATINSVTIDRTITMEIGKVYSVMIRFLDDSLITAGVTNVPGDTNLLSLTGNLPAIPQQYDLWVFGEVGKVAKPFIVLDIDRKDDKSATLTGIEYVPAVYEESLSAPAIDYSALDKTQVEVIDLAVAQETYMQKDGTVVSVLHCSWNLPRGKNINSANVYYSRDNGQTWAFWENTISANSDITGVKSLETYLVKVCTMSGLGVVSTGVTSSIYITGKDSPPSNVPSITASIDPTDSTKILLAWPAVTDIDLNGYQLMEGSTILTPTPISDTRYTFTASESRQHTFSVRAIDNSGNPSVVPATITINVTVEPAQVAGFSAVIQETDRSRLNFAWVANTEADISYYEIRSGNNWSTAVLLATQLKATNYPYQLIAEGHQTYQIKAYNVSGHASVVAAIRDVQVNLRPDTPTNLVAVQEPRDRSMVKITWTPSPGKDIAGYELKSGNDWDTGTVINTATDPQCGWCIPSSGTYNIMVRAKTVAGYASNVANVSITAFIEAYDVTGFAAIQMIADRTKVRLSWDRPISLDVTCVEIRKGVTWDTGAIVGQGVTGTFFDVIVTEETEQTFWIKAITVAGNYSQNPVATYGIFNMNPSPVSNIQIGQVTDDKSIVNIMWLGISEADLVGYQVKVGLVWETAEALPLTQELYTTYHPSQTGNVKVMIKTVNAAGYYSDEVSGVFYATLEPQDVTGLVVYQNGETVELFWDKATEPDVVAYEIHEGANFEQGSLVAGGVTQSGFVANVDTERNYQYFVKAINRSGRYSQRAASKVLFVTNLPIKNVISTFDEIALATGTHSNTEFGTSLINFSNMGSRFSDYPTTKFSDVGGAVVLKLLKTGGVYPVSGVYACQRIDVGQVITANITVRFVSTVIFKGTGSARLQIKTSQDGSLFTAWQDFKPVQYTFRYADFQVLMGTTDVTKTPEVNQFVVGIDVPDYDFAKTFTVPVGGLTVSYGHPFYTLPILTPTAIGEGLRAELISKTTTDCMVKVKNAANTDVGGSCDLRGKGF